MRQLLALVDILSLVIDGLLIRAVLLNLHRLPLSKSIRSELSWISSTNGRQAGQKKKELTVGEHKIREHPNRIIE